MIKYKIKEINSFCITILESKQNFDLKKKINVSQTLQMAQFVNYN